MSMAIDQSFIPGNPIHPTFPLGRYLPPIPDGMIAGWLNARVAKTTWVLDPLGATPQLALEAARAGYRVLVASNNPILTFMLEVLAQAPTRSELLAVLAELGAARRGEERLEVHFRNLYQTECAACHQLVQVQAFLWRRNEPAPFARVYACPLCGDEGERPITQTDLDRLALPGNPQLHLARALERIALPGDPLREGAQEAAQFFLPRSLYFLTTLINRIEGLGLPEHRRRLLTALALSVCDDANSLWPYPEARGRPRQLTIPPIFRENNLWAALEAAVERWCMPGAAVPVSRWPDLPPQSGGICLFPGRLKALLPLPPEFSSPGVLAVLPRPNQAFWTLSALWSGWLWGREAVLPLRYALERQRYDWHWHAQALYSIFSALTRHLPAEIAVGAIVPELGPGFLSAIFLAAETADLHLEGLALQVEDELAQLSWKSGAPNLVRPAGRAIEPVLQRVVQEQIARAGEPALYLALHAAGLSGLVGEQLLLEKSSDLGGEVLTRLQNSFVRVFKAPGLLKHYERQASHNIETGWWWLAAPPAGTEMPLADRVEMELVKWVIKNPGRSFAEIQSALCNLFPGLLTPSVELISVCLDSYAALSSGALPGWQIRPSEAPAVRRADLETIGRGLNRLGKKIGLTTRGEMPLTWLAEDGTPTHLLFPMASAVISKYVFQPQPLPAQRCILVVPGSRVNLILYKMQRDPRLAQALAAGWRFMKFRQLRQMLDLPQLDPNRLEDLLNGDPPHWEGATQLSIF